MRVLRPASLAALLSLVAGCGGSGVDIELDDLTDGLARFEVENERAADLATFSVEITYFDADGAVLLVDTARYQMEDQSAFLAAGAETTIAQRGPAGVADARARVLEAVFVE